MFRHNDDYVDRVEFDIIWGDRVEWTDAAGRKCVGEVSALRFEDPIEVRIREVDGQRTDWPVRVPCSALRVVNI